MNKLADKTLLVLMVMMRLQWLAFLLCEVSLALASAIVVAEGPAAAPLSIAGVSRLLIATSQLKNT